MTQYQKKEGGCTFVDPGCPCGPPSTSSQPVPPCLLDYYWATSITGIQSTSLWGVAVGVCGNVYVIGRSDDTTTFNSFLSLPPNPASTVGVQPFGTTLSDQTNQFVFVAKYNGQGIVQWVTKIGQPQGETGQCDAFGIALDVNENVYITGAAQSFAGSGAIDIYNSDASLYGTLSMSGTTGIFQTFVIAFDTNGMAQWATYLGGVSSTPPFSYNSNQPRAITVDANSNVFITGLNDTQTDLTCYNFHGILPGPIVDTQLYGTLPAPISGSLNSGFVVKFLPNGTVDWVTNISVSDPNGGVSGTSIAVDGNGDAYVSGVFYGGVPTDILTFYSFQGLTPPTINVVPYGFLFADSTKDRDIFVVKYTGSGPNKGQVVWATSIVTTNTAGGIDESLGITVDGNSNVYVTGFYTTGIDIQSVNVFQPPPGGGQILLNLYGRLVAPNQTNAFIVKYNSAGVVSAVTTLSGVATILQGVAITTDANADIYVTGLFDSATVQANNAAPPIVTIITPTLAGIIPNDTVPGVDTFVVKFNSSLTSLWANRIGAGTSSARPKSIAVDPNGNVHVVGDYGANAILTSAGLTTGGPVVFTPYGFLDNPFQTGDGFIVKYDTNGQI